MTDNGRKVRRSMFATRLTCAGMSGTMAGLFSILFAGLVLAGEVAPPDAAPVAPVQAPAEAQGQAWPKWRQAMTLANTIYDISDNAVRDLRFVFPGGQIPSQFANADDGFRGTGAGIINYGGGALLRGVGKYGVLAFGSGGHNFAGNYTGALNLNGDVAHYEVWQQPIYALKPTAWAESYWSPGDAAALPANRRLAIADNRLDARNWDGQFPIAIGNWVYPARVKYVEVFVLSSEVYRGGTDPSAGKWEQRT
jgi:hypothetical protein